MRAEKRFTTQCVTRLRAEIRDAGENEVFALGYLDERGLVARIRVRARGNEDSVLAPGAGWGNGPAEGAGDEGPPDLLIHNHPSGFLTPSDNDLRIAGRAAGEGIGAYIVDNPVENVYVVAEPVRRRVRKTLESGSISAALREGGAVAGRLPAYEPRQAQLDLMELIIRGFNGDALVAAEAGTGVGKSFAYLLPAIHYALDNDERIVISTATITLQQQLFEKDIPLVTGALNKKIKAVLMKGRGNYLCRRRLTDTLREPDLEDLEREELERIAAWVETTHSGSRTDLSFIPAEVLWARICSEADLCMGMRCPERERCFVFSLRREAADARLLVVNHHLLFADLAARREGAGYDNTVVLPPFTRVIIDEAHTMEGAATSFFSDEWSRPGIFRQLGRLYRRRRAKRQGLLIRLAAIIPGMDEKIDSAATAIEQIREAADALDLAAGELCGGEGLFRLCPRREDAEGVLFPGLKDLRKKILVLTELIRELLEQVNPNDEDNAAIWEIKPVLRRLEAIGGICGSFVEYRERPHEVMWLEKRRSEGREAWVVFHVTPVDVAPGLREALFEPNKTVICVSATLTISGASREAWKEDGGSRQLGPFSYWAGRCGLNLVREREVFTGQFPSPFPYAASVLLAVPSDAPLPEEENYQAFVDRAAAQLASAAGGSALILFTSYQSLRSAYSAALPELTELGIRCLKQGDDDRTRLLQTFLADESSVLFATDSFWEGVDAPGDTLRLVILCRLPFRTPNDPVFEARREALEQRGGNSFMDLSLPESVMKFKQGFGRLIRRSGDSGVVAVLDGRLLRKRYGEFFLRSLPETKTCFGEFKTILKTTEDFLYPGV
ncbi:MAG: ATP-dependent DNA helicase DinG [Treponema sp.]|jgi:ATP-dependent DNA helicase DinG|nr:ATP-dependent DNA helicase DinG [Treponema sp.]